MNNKVTLQDLAEQLSSISGQSKKLSENFLRALTEIIEQSLEKDGIAKVKGIGTFKIIAIEERKSVSVTDGSAVVIPAHKKITFTPEKELKEAVNKPYEHLETYILPNDGPVDAPVTDDEEEEAYAEEEMAAATVISAVASSSMDSAIAQERISEEPISAINKLSPIEEPSNIDIETSEELSGNAEAIATDVVSQAETTVDDIVKEEVAPMVEKANQEAQTIEEVISTPVEATPQQEAVAPNVEVKEIVEETPAIESNDETATSSEPEIQKIADDAISSVQTATENAPENAEEPMTSQEETNDGDESVEQGKKKGKKKLLWMIILLIILLLGCLVYAFTQNPNFCDQFNDIKEKITNLVSPKGDNSQKEAVAPTQADSIQMAKKEEQEQQDFIEQYSEPLQEEIIEEENIPVAKEDYDWFDKDFKKFMKREHPKIRVEVLGEPATDTIKAGKTLTSMSRKYYNGGKDFWVYIYLYNKKSIRKPDEISAGTVIKIPQLHPSMVNPSSYESVNAAKDVKESYLRLFN